MLGIDKQPKKRGTKKTKDLHKESQEENMSTGSKTVKAAKPTVVEMIERKKNVQDSSKVSNLPFPKKKKEEGTTINKSKSQTLGATDPKPSTEEFGEASMRFPTNFSSQDYLDQSEPDKLLIPSIIDEKKKTPMFKLLESFLRTASWSFKMSWLLRRGITPMNNS